MLSHLKDRNFLYLRMNAKQFQHGTLSQKYQNLVCYIAPKNSPEFSVVTVPKVSEISVVWTVPEISEFSVVH